MAIHPTAVVDKQAQVAASAEIGPFAIIEGPVKIGENVKVYPNAYISGWTEIGDGCEIHPSAIVGHLPQDFHFEGGRSYCRIGAGTIIRECASIHRGTQTESTTTVGENCFLLAYSHVGHNCEVGNNVKVYNGAILSGHVTVGDNTIISGQVMVHQFCRIGEYVMIGGGARVTKDVPHYMKCLFEAICVGYNAIGLKRSGQFTQEEVNDVRRAYKTIYQGGLPFRKAVDMFEAKAETRAGRHIVEFLRCESKLGYAGGRKAGELAKAATQPGDED